MSYLTLLSPSGTLRIRSQRSFRSVRALYVLVIYLSRFRTVGAEWEAYAYLHGPQILTHGRLETDTRTEVLCRGSRIGTSVKYFSARSGA
jgi:hypothetical protein